MTRLQQMQARGFMDLVAQVQRDTAATNERATTYRQLRPKDFADLPCARVRGTIARASDRLHSDALDIDHKLQRTTIRLNFVARDTALDLTDIVRAQRLLSTAQQHTKDAARNLRTLRRWATRSCKTK